MERTYLKKARKEKGMRQSDFASALGVHRTTIVAWEDGTKDPHPDLWPKIRRVLGSDNPKLFDICQKVTTDQQLSPPCQTTENHDIVESADLTIHIPGSVRGIKEFMDMLRRQFIDFLAKAGGATILGNISFAIVPSPTVDPGEYLNQCSIAIEACWQWLNQGNYRMVERALNAHVSTLARFANTISPFQNIAANLASQANILQIILATRNLDFVGLEIHCAEAVRFAAMSGDRRLLATALDWQGNTYTTDYANFFQPQKAISILDDALAHLGSNDLLIRSAIYSDLSIAYAQDPTQEDFETKARDYAELAHMMMPEYPELDPLYPCIQVGESELYQFEGKMYLYLAEHSPHSGYAELAYYAFDKAASGDPLNPHYQCGSLVRKAEAACVLGDMDGFVEDLTEGFRIAIKIDSPNRITKAANAIGRAPSKWKQETAVQKLQQEITHAIKERSPSIVIAHR